MVFVNLKWIQSECTLVLQDKTGTQILARKGRNTRNRASSFQNDKGGRLKNVQ